ncbi:MAG: hypothetical protein WDO13_11960 [Verrucomicrobiota bacterium]
MAVLDKIRASTRLVRVWRRSVPPEAAEQTSRQILDQLFGREPLRNVAFRLWNGTTWPADRTGDAGHRRAQSAQRPARDAAGRQRDRRGRGLSQRRL